MSRLRPFVFRFTCPNLYVRTGFSTGPAAKPDKTRTGTHEPFILPIFMELQCIKLKHLGTSRFV
jgi:hypothetical protein